MNLGVGEKAALPIRYDYVSGAIDFKSKALLTLGHLDPKNIALGKFY